MAASVSREIAIMKKLMFLFRCRAGLFWALTAALCLGVWSTTAGTNPSFPAPSAAATESGTASYYADKYHGQPTASGEVFDMHQLTAAHPRLKFGTVVRVTNLDNHRSVLVRINDRGPFVAGRIIDVSLAAAEELQMIRSGLAAVTLEVLPK